ncbi:type 11 methyltransferase [Neobacillus bataviensis LMG 21833]|uniref:Type 11 methyltransferase n=1 Tax=Neobacillus bataviensis LMG 21833 TaxID=1117379 RepID=K6DH43_9BACI|nr:class I SAM-dependent methyltransferase [Neobacillus bataviensis]EKN67619.1 type 11 methyltransferase [Neobacillus bataviensis LMG 21833]
MSHVFAKWYDFFMNPLEKRKFKQIRKELLSNATGCVLELGSGTGVNFPFYNNEVEKVTAVEPSKHMIEQSTPKLKQSIVPIEIVQAGAEELPFAANTFDTVVATLVFCTIPNPGKALLELKRVCKPEGKILLFEHVKMENHFLGALQEMLTPAWKKICDGCCLNRKTIELLKLHNITITSVQKYYRDLFVYIESVNKK